MHSRSVTAFSIAFVLAAACADQRPASPDEERQRLEARQDEFFQAMSARDADRVSELFSDDAVLQVANMPPIAGRSAIRDFYGNLFGFLGETAAAPRYVRVSESGDIAYGIGTTANEFRGPEGAMRFRGKYLLVWEKAEEEWVIAAYSISSDHQEPER